MSAFLRTTQDAARLAEALRCALSVIEHSAPAEPGTGERQWRQEMVDKAKSAVEAHDELFGRLDLPTSLDPAAQRYIADGPPDMYTWAS